MDSFLNLAIRLMAGQDATEAMTEIRKKVRKEERKTDEELKHGQKEN